MRSVNIFLVPSRCHRDIEYTIKGGAGPPPFAILTVTEKQEPVE